MNAARTAPITGRMLTLGEMHAGAAGLVITSDRNQALNWLIATQTDPNLVTPWQFLKELEFLSSRYYPDNKWHEG